MYFIERFLSLIMITTDSKTDMFTGLTWTIPGETVPELVNFHFS